MIHKRCSGVRVDLSLVADVFMCGRCDGTIQEADLAEDLMVDGETYKCVKKQNQKWMDEVPRDFAISDIQSSPVGDERSSLCQLCQKSMIYGSETRPLLVDVGLKFERHRYR